jgi:hypothetical protein
VATVIGELIMEEFAPIEPLLELPDVEVAPAPPAPTVIV